MTIDPIPSPGISAVQDLNSSLIKDEIASSVTSIENNIQTIKDSSLLYQLVNSLSLSSKQDQFYNSMLMMRLQENRQFIEALTDTKILNIEVVAESKKVTQLSDYQTNKSMPTS